DRRVSADRDEVQEGGVCDEVPEAEATRAPYDAVEAADPAVAAAAPAAAEPAAAEPAPAELVVAQDRRGRGRGADRGVARARSGAVDRHHGRLRGGGGSPQAEATREGDRPR